MNKLLFVPLFAVILLLIDYYVFQGVKTLFSENSIRTQKIVKYTYWSISVCSIILFFIFHFVHPDLLGKNTRTIILSLLFMMYVGKILWVFFLLIDDIIRLIRTLFSSISNGNENDSEISKTGVTRLKFLSQMGVIASLLPAISLTYGVVRGAHRYRLHKKDIFMQNLPAAFNDLKIVQISDIHSGSFWDKKAVEKGIQLLLDQKPDIIFFTGDLVNNLASEMDEFIELFNKLEAPMGVYSILGNHDYGDYHFRSREQLPEKIENFKKLKEVHKAMGWKLLLNENVRLVKNNESIGLIGVENLSAKHNFSKYGDLKKAYKGIENEPVKILLSHDPSSWKEWVLKEYQDINLTLSGHTHGMQFGIETGGFKWSPIKYFYPEWAGLYSENNQHLYVNRGFGYLGYPGRFGIEPEISVLTLKKS